MANINNANMVESPEKTKGSFGRKSSRAIQLTPKSRFRIINKFRAWRRTHQIDKQIVPLKEEVFHLEDRKDRFSKNPYMIEYGEIDRIQKKIDRVQEKITILLEEKDLINSGKMVLESKKKPLRLLPSMYREFNGTCRDYHAASANVASAKFNFKGKKSNSDLEEVTSTVDRHQQGINITLQQEMNSSRNILSDEEKEIHDVVEAHLEQSRNKLQAELENMEINDTVETHLEQTQNELQTELEKIAATVNTGSEGNALVVNEERVRPLQGFDANIKDKDIELNPFGVSSDEISSPEKLAVMSGNDSTIEEIKPISFNPDLTSESSSATSVISFDNGSGTLENSSSNSVGSLKEFRKSLEKLQEARKRQIEKEKASINRKNQALRMEEESAQKRQEMMDRYTKCAAQLQQEIQTSIDRETEANKITEDATRQAEQNFADANEFAEMLASVSTDLEEMGRRK